VTSEQSEQLTRATCDSSVKFKKLKLNKILIQ